MRERGAPAAEGGRHSLAIVLHGKIGGMTPMAPDVSTSSMMRVRSVDGAPASSSMMALSYASLLQHVIAPNRRRGIQLDILAHTASTSNRLPRKVPEVLIAAKDAAITL